MFMVLLYEMPFHSPFSGFPARTGTRPGPPVARAAWDLLNPLAGAAARSAASPWALLCTVASPGLPPFQHTRLVCPLLFSWLRRDPQDDDGGGGWTPVPARTQGRLPAHASWGLRFPWVPFARAGTCLLFLTCQGFSVIVEQILCIC